MDVASRTAEMSYATRLKVGAVAVKDKRIILCGYNGTPEGSDNTCEDVVFNPISDTYTLVTKSTVLHAEENLILYASKVGISLKGATLYCTTQPCLHCSRMLYGCGIVEVIYKNPYRCDNGLDFLASVGVPCRHYKTT